MGEETSYLNTKENNLPYQDTFDNGGTDINEPLASARYRHKTVDRDDSISTERSKGKDQTYLRFKFYMFRY